MLTHLLNASVNLSSRQRIVLHVAIVLVLLAIISSTVLAGPASTSVACSSC